MGRGRYKRREERGGGREGRRDEDVLVSGHGKMAMRINGNLQMMEAGVISRM